MIDQNYTYLLLGPENGEKAEYIKEVRRKIKIEDPNFEEFRFYPFETSLTDIISIIQNGSLFSSKKIVIINNIESIKKRNEIDLLASYCSAPSPDVRLFLVSSEIKVNSRIEKAIKKQNRIIFWELFEDRKKSWIIGYFKRNGMSISNDAVDLILDMIVNNTAAFKRECDKIILFFNSESEITLEKLEELIYHSKEENVFTLFGKIVTMDTESSLCVLQNIMLSKTSEPIQLLSGLLWQFRKLLSLKELLLQQYDIKEAFASLNIRGRRNQRVYSLGSSNFSVGRLEKIIALIAENDALFRTVKKEMYELLFSLFIYKVCKTQKS